MGMTVGQIAHMVGGTVSGDPNVEIVGVNGLLEAQPGELTFARSPRYFPDLLQSRASAAFTPCPIPNAPMPLICVPNPDVAFLMLLQYFAAAPTHPSQGIHPTAIIEENVVLGDNVTLGAYCYVASGSRIGHRAVLYPGVYIGNNCHIGDDSVLYPHVVIREDSIIGARCILHSGVCIGSDGFGFVETGGKWHKIPQTGKVIIGDDVEIGSNTAIDRATFGATRIGTGTKIDNLVQIGHNVQIGDYCAIAGKAGIAGSARIGNHVRIGADAGIGGHLTIGDGATIGARAGVTRSIEAGKTVSGFPALDHAQMRRILVAQQRTPEMLRRINEIERQLKELKAVNNHETTNHS